MITDVIIPAYNEQDAIALVIADIPKNRIRTIFVADNNSSDLTAEIAQKAGAEVLTAKKQGYGSACLAGLAKIHSLDSKPDVVVFLDADYSDYPQEMNLLLDTIETKNADLVIGNRIKEKREKGAMTPQQIAGNKIASVLIKWLYGFRYHDLGPFRAVRYEALVKMNMQDKTYGWTVEMQVKALNHKMKIEQVEVSYRRRKGFSKISGTVKGTILAGVKIINTIIKYR